MIRLFINEVPEGFVRQNFKALVDYFRRNVWDRAGFQFFEYTFTKAVTGFDVPHKLNYRPKDILQLSVTGGAVVTWNFDDFDRTYVNITTDKACTVRAFIGSYGEENI
jgi:hypothetical protein